MRRTSLLLSILVLIGSIAVRGGVVARQASPVAGEGERLDLAAMALASDDVPTGFFDDYGEWLLTPAALSDFVLGGTPVPAGLVQVYQSFYFNNADGVGIHNYLFAYDSPEAAVAGAGIVNEVFLRPPLPEGTVNGPATSQGAALGDDASTITLVTFDTSAEDGPLVDVVASSFRRDRIIAGVAIERYSEPPHGGTPITIAEDPVAEDTVLAESLATTLDDRISAVMSGDSVPGADLALSEMLLPIEQLSDEDTPVLGGYKSGIDLLRCGVCGEENSLLQFAEDAIGGVARTLAVGPLVDGEPQPPFVSVAITEFTSFEVALEVLEAMRQAPNDRPTSGPTPRGERTIVDDPEISGVDAVLGFEGVFDPDNPVAVVDSAGVSFVSDTLLVTVEVQGGLSGDAAMEVALDLATQQSICVSTGEACVELTAPQPLLALADATPAAVEEDLILSRSF